MKPIEVTIGSATTQEEQREFASRLQRDLDEIERLAFVAKTGATRELDFDEATASQQDRDALQELVEEQLLQSDDFQMLVDEILDDVQARFDFIQVGSLVSKRDGWHGSGRRYRPEKRNNLRLGVDGCFYPLVRFGNLDHHATRGNYGTELRP